jgi:hypothetical protein
MIRFEKGSDAPFFDFWGNTALTWSNGNSKINNTKTMRKQI